MTPKPWRLWGARFLVGLVLLINLQCAASFLISPGFYMAGFEVDKDVGTSVVRGMGILFLMWNVPYVVALSHPVKRLLSLYEAIAMQAIGLVGESWLSTSVPASHSSIQAALQRFILFDGAGLAALILAAWIAKRAGD